VAGARVFGGVRSRWGSALTSTFETRHAARVATYAFVNPVVALFWAGLLGGEVLTLRTILATR